MTDKPATRTAVPGAERIPSPGSTDTGAPPGLWNRDFRLFLGARTVARFGDGMVPVALAAGLLDAGYGVTSVSFALGAWMACFAGFVLFGGVLADRFSPRRMMVGADAARLVGAGVLAVAFASGTPALWLVHTLSAVSGLGAALFQPGVAGMTPQLSPDVQHANAVIRVSESLMSMAGPATAGALIGLTGTSVLWWINAATFGVSGLCLFLIRMRPVLHASGESFLGDLVTGWREFTSRAWLWGVIAIWTGYGLLVLGPLIPLGAVVVTERFDSTTYGFMMAVYGAGEVVGGLAAMRLRPRRPLLAGALALLGVPVNLCTLALSDEPLVMGAGFAVGGASFAFWLVMWFTCVQTHIPHEALNRIHAYDVAGSLLMIAAGRALAGPAAEWIGAETVLLAGIGVSLAVVALLLGVPAIRNLRRAT